MEVFSCVGLFALICAVVVEAGKFENFIVNVEEITKTNRECKQTLTECKQTVEEQKNTINELKAALASNLTGKIDALEERNTNLTTKIEFLEETVQALQAKNVEVDALNSTLANMQGMVYRRVH